jgi:predicted RecA/RadA family phage recombinase
MEEVNVTDLWPDAEVGEMITDGTVLSFEAATTITKGNLVYLSADMTVSKCTAPTQHALGVALSTVETGEYCSVCTRGVVKVTAGAAITRGKAVQTDADANITALEDGSGTYDPTELPDRISRTVGIALQTFADGDTGLIHVDKA